MHDDQAVERDLEEVAQRGHRAAGLVHVGAGLGEHDAPAGQAALDDVSSGLVRLEAPAHPRGQCLDDAEADVVAVAGVFRSGIAQADDEPEIAGVCVVGGHVATTAPPQPPQQAQLSPWSPSAPPAGAGAPPSPPSAAAASAASAAAAA